MSLTKNRFSCSTIDCVGFKEHKALHLKYYQFPLEEKIFEEWATNCNREDLLIRQDRVKYAHNNCQLCELHFEDDMFQEGSKRLKATAFPTIFGSKNVRKNINRDFNFDAHRSEHSSDDDENEITQIIAQSEAPEIEEIFVEEIKTELIEGSDIIPVYPDRESAEHEYAAPSAKKSKRDPMTQASILQSVLYKAESTVKSTIKNPARPLATDLLTQNSKMREIIQKNEQQIGELRIEYKQVLAEFVAYKAGVAKKAEDSE